MLLSDGLLDFGFFAAMAFGKMLKRAYSTDVHNDWVGV